MEITIKGEDRKLLKQVEDLARKLGLKISKRNTSLKDKNNGAKMAKLMAKMAKKGGIKSIPDPAAWQREIRKDRILPGRDES